MIDPKSVSIFDLKWQKISDDNHDDANDATKEKVDTKRNSPAEPTKHNKGQQISCQLNSSTKNKVEMSVTEEIWYKIWDAIVAYWHWKPDKEKDHGSFSEHCHSENVGDIRGAPTKVSFCEHSCLVLSSVWSCKRYIG